MTRDDSIFLHQQLATLMQIGGRSRHGSPQLGIMDVVDALKARFPTPGGPAGGQRTNSTTPSAEVPGTAEARVCDYGCEGQCGETVNMHATSCHNPFHVGWHCANPAHRSKP